MILGSQQVADDQNSSDEPLELTLDDNKLLKVEFQLMNSTFSLSTDVQRGGGAREETVFIAEFKRHNNTFCLWEDEKDRSTNAILVTLPNDVREFQFYLRNSGDNDWKAYGQHKIMHDLSLDFPTTTPHQILFRQDSIWVNGFIISKVNVSMFYRSHDIIHHPVNLSSKANAIALLFPRALSSQEIGNLSIELVASHVSIAINEDDDKSTQPISSKILIGVLSIAIVFILLSLMLCLNKRTRTRLWQFCTVCCNLKQSQELTHDTVTITMHEMKSREK